MQKIACPQCSSSDFEMRKVSRQHHAARFYALKCKQCNAYAGVVDSYQVADLIRHSDAGTKKVARQILDRLVVSV